MLLSKKKNSLPPCENGVRHAWSKCVFCLKIKPKSSNLLPFCVNEAQKRHRWLLCAKCGITRKQWRGYPAGCKFLAESKHLRRFEARKNVLK